ncbi:MAG: DUF5110 domain-containing protein, partial [Muribaculum sp.]|nr:DUF5110 domain-containing protein [Muribaculum sp.]
AILLCTLANSCAKNTDGTISTVTADGRTVTVTAIDDNIVRVTNAPDGTTPSATQGAIAERQPFHGSISTDKTLSTMILPSGLTVTLDMTTGAVTFLADGVELIADNAERQFNDSTNSLALYAPGDDIFYGAGERGHSLTLNGDTLQMYNTQNYGYTEGDPRIRKMGVSVPLMVSSLGYGVLFDDVAAATMILREPIVYTTEARDPVSYYFIYGNGTLQGVTDKFTALTGRQPLPPLWSLGYITSKYGYHDSNEAIGVVDTLQSMGYPVDGIVLDLYWYGEEENMGALRWDSVKWPDTRQFLALLKDRGVNTVLITQPYVNKEGASQRYNELAENDMFVVDSLGNVHDMSTWIAECSMIDVANPATREWYKQVYKELTDGGVAGWWGDLGDLETHPSTVFHRDGKGNLIPARLYHNQYGNDWSSIIHSLYTEQYPETRLMSLMRGGTTGLQRYSVFPWSTDVSRSWGGLQPQIKIMLSSGLSGLGYMHHDVGGFAIDRDNPRDPELYVRWLQLGVFSPVLRTHSQTLPEPYHYPEYADVILDLVRERYRWLPYNYTLAYENSATGAPLVRPLNFNDPQAPADIDDQYMWGNEVMVAPVMEKGATSRRIIVPAGTWIDYNNPDVSYIGPDTVTYSAPLDVMPLLVRSGAFIPQAQYIMNNVGDYDTSRYDILFYPRTDGMSSYSLYEDDLTSASALKNGNFALINFHSDMQGDKVSITVSTSGSYPSMAETKTLTFRLPGISAADISDLIVDGKPTTVSGKNEATFKAKLDRGSELKITFSLR